MRIMDRKQLSEEEHSGEVSGEDEQTTVVEKRGLKTRQRAAMARKECGSRANIGAPGRLTRSSKSTVRSAQPRSTKIQSVSRHVKDEESSEDEDSKGETSEAASSDNTRSVSSEDSDRVVYAKSSSRTKFSKRKSGEIDYRLSKKVRRQGRGSGDLGPHDVGKPALKAESESDEDFVMEGSGDGSSCSEDDKDSTDEESNGDSSDGYPQEDVKRKTFKKHKDPRTKKEKSPKDVDEDENEASSDEEVCSVCSFAGAADLMLLCDGENCEEAFHSFCLEFPLHSIPEEDWLCPLCVHEKHAEEVVGKPVKRTSGLRSKVIPSIKKIESIIGFREDPSAIESDKQKKRNLQYLVKWCSLSHRHDTWVPEDWVFFADRTRLASYRRKSSIADGEKMSDERRPEWLQIDRVIACRDRESHSIISPSAQGAVESQGSSSSKREYLVKWTNIEYNGSTWEEENKDKDMQEAVTKFFERHELAEKKTRIELTGRLVASTLTEQPKYLSGGVLHDYQFQGLKWLLSNYQQRKNVILADEMGLGKTIQAVSLIMALKHEHINNKPVLVIGPKSTLVGWEQELRRWGADLNSVMYHGEKESRIMIRNYEFYSEGKIPLFDALVTSYDLAMLDNGLLQKFDWSCIIVDEGHRVKNSRSKLGTLLKRQTTDFRLLLTGTPVQNTLTELFALLHFLDPSEFPDPERSAQEFAQVDALSGAGSRGEGGIEQQISRLHELLTPRMLRRLKANVLQGMIPGKKYKEVMCSLTTFQRHLYGAILKKNHKQLNRGITTGKKRSLNFILMDLKMVCNHPYLIPGKEPEHGDPDEIFKLLVSASGKLQLLEKLLPKLKERGHRVLLFSQMTTMLDILEDFLSHLNFKFCRIDGATAASERQKQITEFNSANSDLFIFLISTRAGGLGINLPSADTVIIYDPDFNPFVDLQAQARAHRIGQENVVLVYQLITKCSVEEKILERSKQKLAMENIVMSSIVKDTAEDVNTLLLHGARKVLKEHDEEATSVKWTDELIESLLDRDISGTEDTTEGGDGYLGAVQGGVVSSGPADQSPLKGDKHWGDLLGNFAELDKEADEGNLGRGKRQRRNIQYSFEPDIDPHDDDKEAHDDDDKEAHDDDDDDDASSASSSESDSDDSLDDEVGSRLGGANSKNVKAMKEEKVLSLPLSQLSDQGLQQSTSFSDHPSLSHLLSQPSSHGHKIPARSKILPPSSSSSPFPNLSSPILPGYITPHISSWPTSVFAPTPLAASASIIPSLGTSDPHSTVPLSYVWNDMAARSGSFGEYTGRVHSSSSVSASQTYQPLMPSLSGGTEPPNAGRTQTTGPAVPFQTAIIGSHHVPEGSSPKALKTTSRIVLGAANQIKNGL